MLANIYKVRDNIVLRKIADEHVLMPIMDSLAEEPKLYGLNKLGHFIWNKIDGKTSLEQILNAILDRFATEREPAEKDLCVFIERLLHNNLITKE